MPSHSIQEGYSNNKETQVVIIRRNTRLCLIVRHEAVRGTNFWERLIRSKKSDGREIYNILISECLPVLERLAPETSTHGLTIEDFLHAPTYRLEIVKSSDDKGVQVVGGETVFEEVAHFLRPVDIADTPDACMDFQHIPAADITLAPRSKACGGVTGPVFIPAGEKLFFKPRESGREKEFDRELEIFCRLKDLNTGLRVSDLHGIVVTGEKGEMTAGMLITLIEAHDWGFHPLERGLCGKFELHQKWEEQVTATLKELHRHGIVWGDANPCNIAIDGNLDAWIIDFGGSNNPMFVDDDKRESIDGDWQGVERIVGEWLPKRMIYPSGEVHEV